MVAAILGALAPILPELIKLIPDVVDVFKGKRKASKKDLSIIKNKIKEPSIKRRVSRKRAMNALAITKNSLEPELHSALSESFGNDGVDANMRLMGPDSDGAQGSNQVLEKVPGENKLNIIKGMDNAISNNSLMRLGMQVSPINGRMPFADQVVDGVRVSGVERVCAVTAANVTQLGNQVQLITLNPRLFTGTRVAVYSTMYQRYFVKKIELQYVPVVSTLEPGQLVMGVLENTHKRVPFGNGDQALTGLMEIKNTIAFPVAYPQTLTYTFENRPQPLWLESSYVSGIENTLINQAQIFIADASNLTANKTYGTLYMKYDLYFYDGWIDREALTQQQVQVYVGTVAVSAPYPACLNVPNTDPGVLADWQQKIPASTAVQYYALFFEEDDTNIACASWPSTYKAGTIMYAEMAATSPPAWASNTSFTVAIYPTLSDMYAQTNKVYTLSQPTNTLHNATMIPVFTQYEVVSGKKDSWLGFHLDSMGLQLARDVGGPVVDQPASQPLKPKWFG